MDDFEYSVDICDRDWQCFFAQCEECNVLPPSLAGLEDSGMSDMDDLGALFNKKLQKVELKTGFLEGEVPVDGLLMCEGSPEELYHAKHSSRGMESVLSGSEEDIHLQSVNIFFEQMKSLSDSQKTAEQSQVGAIKNRAVQEEASRDGQPANCNGCTLPRNNPKLNSGCARGEVAAGIKTVSTIWNAHTIRTDESGSESSTSLSVNHPYLKTQLFIGEESSPENTVSELTEPQDSSNKAVCSTPPFNKVIQMDKETLSARKTPNADLCRNPDLVVNGKWTEDKSTQVSQSDTDTTYKPQSKESSPCASVKRKRRKKRRLSVEPADNVFTCERLYDSEDELFTWRRAVDPCFSKECNGSGLKGRQRKYGFMPPLGQYKLSSSLPFGVLAEEIRMKDPFHPDPQSSHHESIFKQRQVHDILLSHDTGFANLWPSIEPKVTEDVANYNEAANIDFEDKQDSEAREIHLESVASSNDNYRNEVKSITNAILLSAESNDPEVDVGQSDRESTAKSVMHEEPETEKVSQCQSGNEPHQQLEIQCPIACQACRMVENITPSPSEAALNMPDHKTRDQTASMASDCISSILDNQSSNQCNLILNGTMQKTKDPVESVLTQDDLSLNHDITEVCAAKAPQDAYEGNVRACGDMGQLQALSESEELYLDSTQSLCYSPEAESVVQLSNKNIPQTVESSCVGFHNPSSQEKKSQLIMKDKKICQNKSHDVSQENEAPSWDEVEVAMTNSQSEDLKETPQKSDNRVFAMSSFWKEMEKLTINDILGLRKESKPQSSFLPPLQETDYTDLFTLSDSGCCSLVEERNLKQDCNDLPTIPDPEINPLSSDLLSKNVLWDSEPLPVGLSDSIYQDTLTLSEISEPADVQRGLRRMSKNISVQNLRALESKPFSYKYNSQTLKPLDQNKVDIRYIPEDPVPKRDSRPSSLTENFRISFYDIYSYFFSEKPDTSQDTSTESTIKTVTDGDSVSENYDHFFSDFDTDNFFYTDEDKAQMVPIFSCAHSSKRKIEFPDAYDYFLVSSSDNSSAESDEEDSEERAPIRVVTRFTHKANSNDIVTDAYEHFYTDGDLRQDFFKASFSFRNSNFKGKETPQKMKKGAFGVPPLKCESRSSHFKGRPITVLGNRDLVFPDRLLYDFNEKTITKLPQTLMYENLQAAAGNPKLDAPLLPLRQSDMCLICIAFASWVLKTANPQVGDTWKAVLLANVSALSAIRYLRKYVKVEATVSQETPNLKSLSFS